MNKFHLKVNKILLEFKLDYFKHSSNSDKKLVIKRV